MKKEQTKTATPLITVNKDTKAETLYKDLSNLKLKKQEAEKLIFAKEKEISDYFSFLENEQLILNK